MLVHHPLVISHPPLAYSLLLVWLNHDHYYVYPDLLVSTMFVAMLLDVRVMVIGLIIPPDRRHQQGQMVASQVVA
jgi:hypothetical protein